MPINGMKPIVDFLINAIGLTNTIIIKDMAEFLAGLSVGVLIMAVLIARIMHRIQHADIGKVTSIRFKYDKKDYYFTKINNFYESLEFIVRCLQPYRRKAYIMADKHRAMTITHIVFAILIVQIAVGVLFATHPLTSYLLAF